MPRSIGVSASARSCIIFIIRVLLIFVSRRHSVAMFSRALRRDQYFSSLFWQNRESSLSPRGSCRPKAFLPSCRCFNADDGPSHPSGIEARLNFSRVPLYVKNLFGFGVIVTKLMVVGKDVPVQALERIFEVSMSYWASTHLTKIHQA